jgi:beta-galactosidase/beta-glucuronidase
MRSTVSLNGTWRFRREGSDGWKDVQLPSTFQDHEGTNFHGIGWYQKIVAPIPLSRGKRVLLHFQAAATEAEVFWDGQRLGSHLGGWTPFRFDITERIRKAATGQPHELRVRLDEKVGHNTQGFLPVVEPHFGGL